MYICIDLLTLIVCLSGASTVYVISILYSRTHLQFTVMFLICREQTFIHEKLGVYSDNTHNYRLILCHTRYFYPQCNL